MPRSSPASTPSGPSIWRRRRSEILLASASILFVFLLVAAVEAALRLGRREAPEGALGPLHSYSEVYGWEPRRNLRAVEQGKVTTLNAAGYRGPELAAEKGQRPRVIVLGDSVAFGLDVDDKDTFAQVLSTARPDIEVANLAVQGYSPGQELIKLQREAIPLRPDVVILALCLGNDFADDALPVFLYDGRHPKLYFTLEDGHLVRHDDQLRLSPRERLTLFLAEHSRLYALVAPRPKGLEAGAAQHWTTRMTKALRDRPAVVDLTAHLIAEMARQCKSRDIAFLVAAFPDKPAYRHGSDWLRELRASAVVEGIPFVDMAEGFHALNLGFGSFTLDGIGHLNPKGHRIAAEILNEALVERGLIPAGAGQPATGAASFAGS